MSQMYYVCNRVDKVELQCSTLEAAKAAWKKCVDNMADKVLWMFSDIDKNHVASQAAKLFYVKQVEYVREEIIYVYNDLSEDLKDESFF